MIEAVNIVKKFNNKIVIDNISFTFESGKTNIIIGRSGSGKTVLIKTLVGLIEPDSGYVLFDSRNFTAMNFNERKKIRQEFGMVFQGGALFDSLTVLDNVLFPLNMFSNLTKKEKIERARFCLNKVNLFNIEHLYPSEISGGMRKRVAIARAIALNPRYLFCDEPNSGLDPYTAVVIDKLIKEITEEFNITTIVNTHDMNSVMGIGDKIIFIHEGKKYWEGTKNEILNSDCKELNDFIFSSEVIRLIKK
ncbi:MAG: ATP-binding cassette domain-containing protein [Bacteroidales bacterium]|nr:ATP-binding cassette domain-containing protein [Bacteroidales bacterium]